MTHAPRRPARPSLILPTVLLAVALAGCTPGAAGPAGSGDDDGGTSASASAARSGIPDLVPVEYDAPRELTATEELMLYEPGPFAGDAFDADAVVEAVLAMRPRTADEWQRAILGQVHGDYADALVATVEFDHAIAGPATGPDDSARNDGTPAGPEEPAEGDVLGTNHFALVLDASGSMAEPSAEGTRMDEAKDALRRFVARLPAGSTVSLRVYGGRGDATAGGKRESCASSDVVYDDEADDVRFAAALDTVAPGGWTPLARALRAVADDVPSRATDAVVYVVTDGLETCGGKPVAAARDLAAGGVEPIVNVIGFQAGDADHEGLRAIADAGGGTYTDAGSATDLERYLDEEYSRMMAAWDAWKRAELGRIEDAGQARMAEAEEYGSALMEAAEAEGRAGMGVARELGDRGALDGDTEQAVWNWFHERKNELWRYGLDTRTANWASAYREKLRDWGETYSTATSRWSEYYRKAYRD